jgi:anti-sigma factor RsiW
MDEARLHAYVDEALGESERAEVQRQLAASPPDAARVAAYRAQNDALHRAFDDILHEPHTLASAEPPARRWRWAAALAATFIGGAVFGAVLHAAFGTSRGVPGATTIARQAALAHAAYLPEVRHPVEVAAAEEQHLVAWLSKRLDTPVKAPSLAASGYRLLGGRLLPPAGEVGDAPVALFMYENAQGRRLSLLVRREPRAKETAFLFSQSGTTNIFYWIDGPVGYALAGEVPRDELQTLASIVYRQLNR